MDKKYFNELARILTKQGIQYPLSRKIRCGVCGTAYRRKMTKATTYWVCRQHDRDRTQCSSERITEKAVYGAFIRLYNHLKNNRDSIMHPMRAQLERLQELKARSHPEISTLNRQIAQLSEQNHVMNGLLSDGILDSVLFISQTDELARKIKALKISLRLHHRSSLAQPYSYCQCP